MAPPTLLYFGSQFADNSLAVAGDSRSLFLPVIQIGGTLGNACAAVVFDVFGGRLAVFFENHPDIGK